MSVKSIGLVNTTVGAESVDYNYPSIRLGESGQIIQVAETDIFSNDALLANIQVLEDEITADNVIVDTLSDSVGDLVDDIVELQTNITALDTQQASLLTTLTNLVSVISQLPDFEPTSLVVLSNDPGLETNGDGDLDNAYYFQPNLGTEDYQSIFSTPSQGMSYSLDTSPSSNLFLFSWNVCLVYSNPSNSGNSDYMKKAGMLFVTLRDGNNVIYYQVKDGNAQVGNSTLQEATISGSGSAIVSLPSGNQTFYPSIFVSSHNEDGVDSDPIKSATSWVYTTAIINKFSQDNDEYTAFSLIKI